MLNTNTAPVAEPQPQATVKKNDKNNTQTFESQMRAIIADRIREITRHNLGI